MSASAATWTSIGGVGDAERPCASLELLIAAGEPGRGADDVQIAVAGAEVPDRDPGDARRGEVSSRQRNILRAVGRFYDQPAPQAVERRGEPLEVRGGGFGEHVDVLGAVALAVGLDPCAAEQHKLDSRLL